MGRTLALREYGSVKIALEDPHKMATPCGSDLLIAIFDVPGNRGLETAPTRDRTQEMSPVDNNPIRSGIVQDIGRYPLWDARWLCENPEV